MRENTEEAWNCVSDDDTRVRVIEVIDGDTLDVVIEEEEKVPVECAGLGFRVRLYGIDAPEMSQGAVGQAAREYLEGLVEGKVFLLWKYEIDERDRIVAWMYETNYVVSLSYLMAGGGWAMSYYAYDEMIAGEEFAAYQAKEGMWADQWSSDADFNAWKNRDGDSVMDESGGSGSLGAVGRIGWRSVRLLG